jgi:hypothetical protein
MWAHYLDSLIAILCTYSSENVDMMVEDAHKDDSHLVMLMADFSNL